jgi:drug/metabolite transporter (DMT)-like permease
MRAHMQFAIILMVTGAIIAGATDLNFSMAGIVYVSVCAVSTAVYLLLIRLLKDKTGVRFYAH